jgi:hypothetical protein
MYVQLPTSTKPTRLNIHRYWRNEFDQLLTVVPAAVEGSPAARIAPETAGEAASA